MMSQGIQRGCKKKTNSPAYPFFSTSPDMTTVFHMWLLTLLVVYIPFTFLVLFLWCFFAKTDLHDKHMFGSFFKQNHLLNLIILVVHAKRWPKCTHISKHRLMYPKIWLTIFFWLSEDLSIERILSFKKCGVQGQFLKKRKLCM